MYVYVGISNIIEITQQQYVFFFVRFFFSVLYICYYIIVQNTKTAKVCKMRPDVDRCSPRQATIDLDIHINIGK